MRPSPLRHPLAVLRYIIGLGQQELADLCGCSRPTIQAVELLKLRLSEKLAIKIADATGVSVAWLLDGDPVVPAEAGPYPAKERFQSGGVIPRGNKSPDKYGLNVFKVEKDFLATLPPDWTVFTRAVFETHRALIEGGKATEPTTGSSDVLVSSRDRTRLEAHAINDIKRLDAEIIELCSDLLVSTQRSRDNYVVRWQIRKFLNDLISKIQPEKSPGSETAKKSSAKELARRKRGGPTPRHD